MKSAVVVAYNAANTLRRLCAPMQRAFISAPLLPFLSSAPFITLQPSTLKHLAFDGPYMNAVVSLGAEIENKSNFQVTIQASTVLITYHQAVLGMVRWKGFMGRAWWGGCGGKALRGAGSMSPGKVKSFSLHNSPLPSLSPSPGPTTDHAPASLRKFRPRHQRHILPRQYHNGSHHPWEEEAGRGGRGGGRGFSDDSLGEETYGRGAGQAILHLEARGTCEREGARGEAPGVPGCPDQSAAGLYVREPMGREGEPRGGREGRRKGKIRGWLRDDVASILVDPMRGSDGANGGRLSDEGGG